AQHVQVVVLHPLPGRVRVVAHRRPDPGELARRDRNPHAAPAQHDPPIRPPGADRLRHGLGEVRVVVGRADQLAPDPERGVPRLLHGRDGHLQQRHPSVVRRDRERRHPILLPAPHARIRRGNNRRGLYASPRAPPAPPERPPPGLPHAPSRPLHRRPLRRPRAPARFTVVHFGATADLALRKLIPALFSLHRQGLARDFVILATARRDPDRERYLARLREHVSAAREHADAWHAFERLIEYTPFD